VPQCPATIAGANVICYTPIDGRHLHTGATRHVVHGIQLGAAAGLVIARYATEPGFYLFGCDEDWNTVSDTWHSSVRDAKAQAEFEYAGTCKTWIVMGEKSADEP
jgi:hypothetical protein